MKRTDFLITTSIDGHVKFWKKTQKGIEFVKHFRAHLGAIVAMSVSPDGTLFATAGSDKAIKIFDIVNFDMINMIKTEYLPLAVCWIFQKNQAEATLAWYFHYVYYLYEALKKTLRTFISTMEETHQPHQSSL